PSWTWTPWGPAAVRGSGCAARSATWTGEWAGSTSNGPGPAATWPGARLDREAGPRPWTAPAAGRNTSGQTHRPPRKEASDEALLRPVRAGLPGFVRAPRPARGPCPEDHGRHHGQRDGRAGRGRARGFRHRRVHHHAG